MLIVGPQPATEVEVEADGHLRRHSGQLDGPVDRRRAVPERAGVMPVICSQRAPRMTFDESSPRRRPRVAGGNPPTHSAVAHLGRTELATLANDQARLRAGVGRQHRDIHALAAQAPPHGSAEAVVTDASDESARMTQP